MHGPTDKPKAICSPLFQSWGHKKVSHQRAVYNLHITCKSEVSMEKILEQLKSRRAHEIAKIEKLTTNNRSCLQNLFKSESMQRPGRKECT